jgi:hypothetical protein
VLPDLRTLREDFEIGAERGGGSAWGYVFFHAQDTQGICAGSVYLAFGAFAGGPTRNGVELPAAAILPALDPDLLAALDAAVDGAARQQAESRIWTAATAAAAREAVSALRDHGLAVDWSAQAAPGVNGGAAACGLHRRSRPQRAPVRHRRPWRAGEERPLQRLPPNMSRNTAPAIPPAAPLPTVFVTSLPK